LADAEVGAGMEPATLNLLARCTFPVPGTQVTCAVSGGADSMSLLVLAVAAGCAVAVIHVDHGLRPGSNNEADVVAAAAARFGAAFHSETIDVPAGPNLEARARDARYAVLPDDVMTGHTADDQAETVLMRALAGATPRALTAMAERSGPLARPLLRVWRADVTAYCTALGLVTVDDPANADPRHLRTRVRHELLPALEAVFPAARRRLCVLAEHQRRLLDG
jgi:tRNA(Ile)-lysidine synthase